MSDLKFIATGATCEACGIAAAAVKCRTKHGIFLFCQHDFRKQMKSPKFQAILTTTEPIASSQAAPAPTA